MLTKGFCLFFIMLSLSHLISSTRHNRRLSRRKENGNNGYRSYGTYSSRLYAVRSPLYYRTRNAKRSSTTSNSDSLSLRLLPGGTEKRTVYTGRYCAYPMTKRVPRRVKNGTLTYLRRVVSQCSWTSLYCNPQVSYVVSTKYSYRIEMRETTQDEWRCCPGFSGPNCDNVCYNCSKLSELTEKVERLSRQIAVDVVRGPFDETTASEGPSGLPGPIGPPGPQGPRGLQGEIGEPGPPGPVGLPGSAGARGAKGETGSNGRPGLTGNDGFKGEKGDSGAPGVAGSPGFKGDKGTPGSRGKPGRPGVRGSPGYPGFNGQNGSSGEPGLPGLKGETGQQGPPGPPGLCDCTSGPVLVTPNPNISGSNTCIHEGVSHLNQALWKSTNCRECICLDGVVECFEIRCPRNDCMYAYKPEGYCCPVCCPYQGVEETNSGSGDTSDGSDETLTDSNEETEPDTENNEEHSSESGHGDEIPLDSNGCPLRPTFRSRSVSKSNEDAVCTLPKDGGPCRARFPKFYYDSNAMKCRVFTYGGCEGNANNFDTPQECRRMCVIGAEPPPAAADVPHDDVYPRRPARCDLPKAVGNCLAMFPRFYYNVEENRCRLFTYRGCNGNENRFFTPWACRDVCGGGTPVFVDDPTPPPTPPPTEANGNRKPRRCYLPKKKGPCKAAHSRFYYNPTTDKCQLFLYGGCAGNDNNFELPTECQEACGGEPSFEYERTTEVNGPEIRVRSVQAAPTTRCSQPMDEGPCRGHFYRYFFNRRSRKCSIFIYGGCRGNENNFESAEECRDRCGGNGFNFTVTLQQDFTVENEPTNERITTAIRGSQGPPGLPGPQGPPGPPASSSDDDNEIVTIKATIERMKTRIVFLETEFLTDQLFKDDVETVRLPEIASTADTERNSRENPPTRTQNIKPHEILRASPVGRGDAETVFVRRHTEVVPSSEDDSTP